MISASITGLEANLLHSQMFCWQTCRRCNLLHCVCDVTNCFKAKTPFQIYWLLVFSSILCRRKRAVRISLAILQQMLQTSSKFLNHTFRFRHPHGPTMGLLFFLNHICESWSVVVIDCTKNKKWKKKRVFGGALWHNVHTKFCGNVSLYENLN